MFNNLFGRTTAHEHSYVMKGVDLRESSSQGKFLIDVVGECSCGKSNLTSFLKTLHPSQKTVQLKTTNHRTHCRRGHRMTRDNTLTDANGSHRCRQCRNAWKAANRQTT